MWRWFNSSTTGGRLLLAFVKFVGPAHSCHETREVQQMWRDVGARCTDLITRYGQTTTAPWWPKCREWLDR